MRRARGLAAWFVYKIGQPLDPGAAKYAFLGDGSKNIPFLAVTPGTVPRYNYGPPNRATPGPRHQLATTLAPSHGQVFTAPLVDGGDVN